MSHVADLLGSALAERDFSGAAYAFGTTTDVLEQGAIGTLAWGGEVVKLDSLWDLASITKPIVGLAVMVFLQQGALSLDDRVVDFLPDWGGTDKRDLTLRMLLTHTSGIPGQRQLYLIANDHQTMMRAIQELPLSYRPGDSVEYSSQGFMLLGHILATVVGESLDVLLGREVLEPLGLADTGFNPPQELMSRIAATEICPWRRRLVRGEVHDENAVVLGGIAGHAGLFSTLSDMVRLCQAMLRMCRGEGGILNGETARLMTRNHTRGFTLGRALAWQSQDQAGSPGGDLFSELAFGHTGFTGTSVWMDPVDDIFAVLLTNRIHPSRRNVGLLRVRPHFHNAVVGEVRRERPGR